MERLFAEVAEAEVEIEQKYLLMDKGMSIRVRRSTRSGVRSYRFTTKVDVKGQCVEIETPIVEEDFDRLWPIGSGLVVKTRYLYQGWEVDFFKHDGANYFAVAEIELAPWEREPAEVPLIVQDHTIYVIPAGDRRFSNKKLGDVQYASALLAEVKEGWHPKPRRDDSSYKIYKKYK